MPVKAGKEMKAAKRRIEAARLRTLGLSYRQIGEQLGVSHEQARKDVRKALELGIEDLRKYGHVLVALEYQRLELPVLKLAARVQDGDPRAIDIWIKLSESKRKLLGLDAPEKRDLTSGGQPFQKSYLGLEVDRV
jgi:hypothetical protein